MDLGKVRGFTSSSSLPCDKAHNMRRNKLWLQPNLVETDDFLQKISLADRI
jgi:hypothetical protein